MSPQIDRPLRLGTRGSRLALHQAHWTAEQLQRQGQDSEIVVITTSGDRDRQRAFGELGAPGLFVREIESQLLDGAIDVAVHSCKDLPATSDARLLIAAYPERLDAADVLLIRRSAVDRSASALPLAFGAVVGTASARRRALLQDVRADLEIRLLRGNLPTRLARLEKGDYDAILLAAAGLERLAREDFEPSENIVHHRLSPSDFVAAPAQGALALQCRGDDTATRAALGALDDHSVRVCVELERAVLAGVEGDCETAFGAYCRAGTSESFTLDAVLEGEAGLLRSTATGEREDIVETTLRQLGRPAQRSAS